MANYGTRVWLYRDESLVGFGSIGTTRWSVPDEAGPKRKVSIIPWVAIAEAFRGRPAGVPRDQRYSSLILDDLISEAASLMNCEPYLCLCVHPDNAAAIRLYERHEFARLSKPFHDKQSGIDYLRMFLAL
jgi:ribosomal protein S18 acetylase RimI-like enzyme